MLSLQKQSGKTAVYITFRISHQLWQKHILHYNKRCVISVLLHFVLQAAAQACVSMLSVFVHTRLHECVCVFVHILLM